ncbi:Variant-specific surface protein, partial [Giardia duodenalis]
VCREERDGACVGYAEETARSGQTAETCTTGAETGKCAPDHCNVQIGDSVYCSQCSGGSSETSSPAPTNGVCTTDNNECSAKANGMCTQCAQQSFMFKGGCYRIGQDPGQAMCKTAVNGVCTVAVETKEYFVPPGADNTHQSVISCADETPVVLASNKQYKGVANCLKCTKPADGTPGTPMAATCDECTPGYFKTGAACTQCHSSCLTCSAEGESGCKSCKDGYFLGATSGAAGKCIKCDNVDDTNWKGVVGCLKCTSSKTSGTPATCTECADNYYLKTDGTPSCVTNCGEGFFPTTVNSIKKCVPCSETSNGGIANCAKCSLTASPARAGAAVTCTECGSGKKLSSLGDACLDNCPAGTYDSSNVCIPCHTSCAECNSNANQDSCTACYPGSVLNKTDSLNTGTCIPECTGRYAENCEANQCTAVLGGSKYCSRCKSGFVPVDGLCVSSGTRAAPNGCTPGDGVCSSCTGTYFLQSGGCYNTQTLPGSSVCTAVTGNNGQCTTCTNGQNANSGVCPACSAGCSKCSGNSGSQTCSECLAGYYLFSSKCVKCDKDDSNITGVPNCVSCAPLAGLGTVTCYVTQTPTVNR